MTSIIVYCKQIQQEKNNKVEEKKIKINRKRKAEDEGLEE